jgi:two-component system NtrC family response regulator
VNILLVDDDRSLRRVLEFKLQKHGFSVTAVGDAREALRELEAGDFALLLSDIRMPGMDGLELLERARAARPDLKVILITAHATVSQAVQAVKLGAFDYVTKPFEDEELLLTIRKAVSYAELEQENRTLKGQLSAAADSHRWIGVSPAFKQMVALVDKIAPSEATVLITGASGTGKELVARRIHAKSPRAGGPLVTVNCAAIPAPLMESELFGHTRGAFTGALASRRGKFALAAGGTIFLDEVGELSTELQAKLLRVLQEQVIEPLGSEHPVSVDVRVLAATNADLEQRVTEGRFRKDLFYRLNVIPVRVPSLSERRDDVPVLAHEFVRRYAGGKRIELGAELLERLSVHDWPGNVRELENLVERMVVLRTSNTLTEKDLPAEFGKPGPGAPESTPTLTYSQAEQRLVLDALQRARWNRSEAARLLDIPRHVLIYRMKKYALKAPR